MASSRLSESGSDYEESVEDNPDLITASEVADMRQELTKKCSVVTDYLLSSKDAAEKRRFIESTLKDLLSAFNTVASSYLRLNDSAQTIASIKGLLKKTIRDEIASAVKTALPPAGASLSGRSYSEVASRSTKANLCTVKVSNGPTVVVPDTVSFVIGPKSESAKNFSTADDTRKAVMKAIKPSEVSLKVSRVLNTRNNAVRIIADSVDVDKLKSSKALSDAGLEVKIKERLNPRLIIRGVPTDLSSADLLNEIKAMNSDEGSIDDSLKVVYRYPPRDNKSFSSVVIETSSDVRRRLLRQGRVLLMWQSCKVEDHLRVLQCFKCQNFGHLAKNCSATGICGHCAGPHETSTCMESKSSPKCYNCISAKRSVVDHRAFDVLKCPIIKLRLTEKAKNISY